MKKYSEKKLDNNIKKMLIAYYENIDLEMHSGSQVSKTEMKHERFSKMFQLSKKDDVLDIGCSSGYLLNLLHDKVKSCYGLDISKNIITSCAKNNKHENVKYDVFNGEDIDVKKLFDKIFLLDVLEHAFKPDRLLNSAVDHLKPSGEIIIEVPFTGFISELITKEYHQGHLRYYDPVYLESYLRKFDLKIEKISLSNSVPFSGFFLRVKFVWRFLNFICNLIPSKFYPYFGEIDIVAKKI